MGSIQHCLFLAIMFLLISVYFKYCCFPFSYLKCKDLPHWFLLSFNSTIQLKYDYYRKFRRRKLQNKVNH